MERRNFLGALTAASLGIALEGSLTEFARAQNTAQFGASLPGRAAKMREFPQNSTVILVHGAWPTAIVGATLFSLWSGAVLK